MPTSHESYPDAVAVLGYELRFEQLTRSGRARAFPCDAKGALACRAMTPRLRWSFHDAVARVGQDYAYPCIVPSTAAWPVAN